MTSRLTLQQLQRRFSRLRQFQSRLHLPAAHYFDILGRRYRLPLRAAYAHPCRHVPSRTLDYLAGFFDGDGCVTISSSRNAIKLKVGQTESSSRVLLLFRNMFGGSVTRQRHTLGLRRPMLQWEVTGSGAERAAALLGTRSSCKRPQLMIACAWTQSSGSRSEAAMTLKVLKQEAPPNAHCPSWQYLAGLFDAEGCIRLVQPASLQLEIGQKFPEVLHAVQAFLAKHAAPSSVYLSNRPCSLLRIGATEVSRRVLSNLLSAGLRVKREAARTAVQLCRQNFHQVRRHLQTLVGNQARYQRLSPAGLERALEIKRLRDRLARNGLQDTELEVQLLALRGDHAWKSAQERLLLVRTDIRSQLMHGASQGEKQINGAFA